MRHHRTSSTAQACGAQVASTVANKVAGHGWVEPQHAQYQQIKPALDVHAASIVVVRMVDGAGGLGEQFQEMRPIRLTPVNGLALVTTRGDVIASVGSVNAPGPRHGGIYDESGGKVKRNMSIVDSAEILGVFQQGSSESKLRCNAR
jgi:hypothetical protein